MKTKSAWLAFFLFFTGISQAQDLEIQAQLNTPVGTQISHKGDSVLARVISPDALRADTIEGKITQAKSGGKIRGTATLRFTFETLQHGNQAIPISSEIKSISNSKGQINADEEGRIIRTSNNVGKVAGGAALGGLIGGIAGGGRGAAIGAGAGTAAAIVLVEVTADGPDVRFDAGSKVTLTAKSRGGPSLASLTANPAAPAAPSASAPATAPVAPAASSASAPATAPAAQPTQSATAAPAAQAGAQPDLTAIKADFIPGEKTIFYDDFSDMAGDEPPPHWKVRGTVPELKVGGGIRQLTIKAGQSATLTPNLKGLPKNFTMETELTIEGNDPDCHPEVEWDFLDKQGGTPLYLKTKQSPGADGWSLRLGGAGDEVLGDNTFPVDWSQPAKLALWVQNGRVRLYLNGQRLFDANQVDIPEIATVQEMMWTGVKSVGYRLVRFAESTPDFSQVISSSGRYVTHGILFDTDSDRLKPESAPVIKSVARGLETNPDLILEIQGHTDSTGSAEHNMDLSRRRAEAVKSVLVSQFGVDARRLTAVGLGSTKPIDSNATPQGRAQNRRVEFVRLQS